MTHKTTTRLTISLFALLTSATAWSATVKVACPPNIYFTNGITPQPGWVGPVQPKRLGADPNVLTVIGKLAPAGVRVGYGLDLKPQVTTIHCTYTTDNLTFTKPLTNGEVGALYSDSKPWKLKIKKDGVQIRLDPIPVTYPLTLNPPTLAIGTTATLTGNADLNKMMATRNLIPSYSLTLTGSFGGGNTDKPNLDYGAPSNSQGDKFFTVWFNTYQKCSGDGTGLTCEVP